ncbi:hypothetical protein [Halobellus sp. GM3]|uniref:hypothetical protein n=1 Tax=Halobellus sp. GM3 TaxID=3458410 RepID=UPI00403E2A75
MSDTFEGIVDLIAVFLLIYVLIVMFQNLWPMLSGTPFAQELIDGAIRGVLIVGLAVVVYFAIEAVSN